MYRCHHFHFKDEEIEASRDEWTLLVAPQIFETGALCFNPPDYVTCLAYPPFSILLCILGGMIHVGVLALRLSLSSSKDKITEGGRREKLDSPSPQVPAWDVTTGGLHPILKGAVSGQVASPSVHILETNPFPAPSGLGMVTVLRSCQSHCPIPTARILTGYTLPSIKLRTRYYTRKRFILCS